MLIYPYIQIKLLFIIISCWLLLKYKMSKRYFSETTSKAHSSLSFFSHLKHGVRYATGVGGLTSVCTLQSESEHDHWICCLSSQISLIYIEHLSIHSTVSSYIKTYFLILCYDATCLVQFLLLRLVFGFQFEIVQQPWCASKELKKKWPNVKHFSFLMCCINLISSK